MIDNQLPQPFQPPERGAEYYKSLRRENTAQRLGEIIAAITTPTSSDSAAASLPASIDKVGGKTQSSPRRQLFNLNINVEIDEEKHMDEQQFLIDLAFKPLVSGFTLTPEQSQLILAHIGEILEQIEAEMTTAPSEESVSCK
jgi:hypothetical protein